MGIHRANKETPDTLQHSGGRERVQRAWHKAEHLQTLDNHLKVRVKVALEQNANHKEGLTFILVLQNRVHGLQQQLEHAVIRLLLQQEPRRRHLDEQLEQLGRSGALQITHVRRDVVDDG